MVGAAACLSKRVAACPWIIVVFSRVFLVKHEENKEEKREDEGLDQDGAATRIQAGYRGHRTRRELKNRKQEANAEPDEGRAASANSERAGSANQRPDSKTRSATNSRSNSRNEDTGSRPGSGKSEKPGSPDGKKN